MATKDEEQKRKMIAMLEAARLAYEAGASPPEAIRAARAVGRLPEMLFEDMPRANEED